MRAVLLILAFTIAGCHPKKPPAAPSSTPACPASVVPTMADACDGRFTTDGHLCVNCRGAAGCFDNADAVYCAAPSCHDDKLCHKE